MLYVVSITWDYVKNGAVFSVYLETQIGVYVGNPKVFGSLCASQPTPKARLLNHEFWASLFSAFEVPGILSTNTQGAGGSLRRSLVVAVETSFFQTQLSSLSPCGWAMATGAGAQLSSIFEIQAVGFRSHSFGMLWVKGCYDPFWFSYSIRNL